MTNAILKQFLSPTAQCVAVLIMSRLLVNAAHAWFSAHWISAGVDCGLLFGSSSCQRSPITAGVRFWSNTYLCYGFCPFTGVSPTGVSPTAYRSPNAPPSTFSPRILPLDPIKIYHPYSSTISASTVPLDVLTKALDVSQGLVDQNKNLLAQNKDLHLKVEQTLGRAHQLELSTRTTNDLYLDATDSRNIRGALELIARFISGKNNKPPSTQSELDKLIGSKDVHAAVFQAKLACICKTHNLIVQDANNCLKKLYHAFSKDKHGSEPVVTIRSRELKSPSERAVLGALFETFQIDYQVVDLHGQPLVQSPYQCSCIDYVSCAKAGRT